VVSDAVLDKINQHIFGRHQLAFICVDHSSKVLEFSENIDSYGFEGLEVGSDVSDSVDFMVGADTHQNLELPMIATPSGIPVVVSMLPDDNCMTVLMLNASSQKEYRSQLQQAANENELLVDQQQKLMRKLEIASDQLQDKNQQLKEANRLQTSFLSGVSHEFRTPLTSIIGYTDLVKKNLTNSVSDNVLSGDVNVGHLRSANRSSRHLLSLVENLLDHGKLDSDEIVVRPKVVDLHEVFDDVDILLKPLCDVKGIDLIFKSDMPVPLSVSIDDSRLRQCLINLVGNAVKFTDQGSVTVDSHWSNDQLSVSIKDTGLGISKEDLNNIRLPFWQAEGTGKAGTGLGLTITERIIELMGGKLSIDLSILLAEDDDDIADLVMMMLAENGVSVSHAKNGVIALQMIESCDYDLILMDLNMPVMNGYEAIEKLREIECQIPVVVMSASALEDESHPIKGIECDGYLVKPVEVNDILQMAGQFVK